MILVAIKTLPFAVSKDGIPSLLLSIQEIKEMSNIDSMEEEKNPNVKLPLTLLFNAMIEKSHLNILIKKLSEEIAFTSK